MGKVEQVWSKLRAALTKCAVLLSVAALWACAVPSTGVVPRGDDRYTVTRQGNGAWVSVDSLKAEALHEADAYCTQQNKRLKFIHSKEIPAGMLGAGPRARCCSAVSETALSGGGDSPSGWAIPAGSAHKLFLATCQ
jgi:hypothetical protein